MHRGGVDGDGGDVNDNGNVYGGGVDGDVDGDSNGNSDVNDNGNVYSDGVDGDGGDVHGNLHDDWVSIGVAVIEMVTFVSVDEI